MCLHHKVQIKRRAKKEIQMEEKKTDNTYDRRNEKRKSKIVKRTISTQKLKLLGEVPGYDLYYSLTHPLK
jgi:hypothetical protein